MRFQTTAIVAALATGAISGPTAHLKHMQIHAARDAEAIDYNQGVNYATVDYSGVNWNSVFGKGPAAATSAAASVATAAPAASTPIAPAVENKLEAPAQAASSVASSAAPTKSSSSNPISDVVNNAVGDVSGMIKSLSANGAGLKVQSAATNAGFGSEGSNGPYVLHAKNNKNTDMMLVVWNSGSGFSSSFVGMGANAPVMTVAIGAGQTKAISFQSGASGAMAPVWAQTAPTTNGQISQTWLEFTFSPTGVVDVSREVDMGGDSISSTVGSTGCKSDMDTCVFKCTDGSQSCMTSYQLFNCNGSGAQASGSSKDGGCGWNGATSETIQAVFG